MPGWEWQLPGGGQRTPAELLVHHRLLSWDIRPGEAVIVIGGYSGAECEFLLARYPHCQMYTFEPQRPFYEALKARFADRPNVHVYPFGLGDRDGTFPMIRAGNNMASFIAGEYAQHGHAEPDSAGELREWQSAMAELGIEALALLHCNIEQYEYVLLPYLLQCGWIQNIEQVVVQFHPFPHIDRHPDAKPREVWSPLLQATHPLAWDGPFGGWAAWAKPGRAVPDTRALLAADGIYVGEADNG